MRLWPWIPSLPSVLTVVGVASFSVLGISIEIEALKLFAPLLVLPGVFVSALAFFTKGWVLQSWPKVVVTWVVMTPVSLILFALPDSLDFSVGGGGSVILHIPMLWGITLATKWGPVILIYLATWTWLCSYAFRQSLVEVS